MAWQYWYMYVHVYKYTVCIKHTLLQRPSRGEFWDMGFPSGGKHHLSTVTTSCRTTGANGHRCGWPSASLRTKPRVRTPRISLSWDLCLSILSLSFSLSPLRSVSASLLSLLIYLALTFPFDLCLSPPLSLSLSICFCLFSLSLNYLSLSLSLCPATPNLQLVTIFMGLYM